MFNTKCLSESPYTDTNVKNFFIFFCFTEILPQIVQCLMSPQQNLKLYALSTLNEIAKHCQPHLAKKIVNMPILSSVMHFLSPNYMDTKVQVHCKIRLICHHTIPILKKSKYDTPWVGHCFGWIIWSAQGIT